MDEPKLCLKQETCPLLMAEIDSKIKIERELRVAKSNAEYEARQFASKRQMFNDFYKLVKRMRAAQCKYFKERTQAALVTSKKLEGELDAFLESLKDASSRSITYALPGME